MLLAAGESRRLGTPKQLARRRGRTLLAHALTVVRAAAPGAPVVVVLGAHALRLRALLRREFPTARVAINPRWQSGLATSLQKGLAAAPRETDALLVHLVDQPDVSAAALGRLLTAWRRHPQRPAAARYSGRVGVPAILPRSTWPAIGALMGDEGARQLLRAATGLTKVDMPEAALDIDTPTDLARLRERRPG